MEPIAMKRLFKLTLFVAFAFALGFPSGVYAKTRGKKAEPPKIEKIDAEAITVRNGHDEKTFKINDQTHIDLNGVKATVKDLKVGMQVSVKEDLIDPRTASAIIAGNVVN